MQKRATGSLRDYAVEYAPFADYFSAQPTGIHINPHELPSDAISSLHHHDAVEVGYCLSGSGVFTVDGENLPFAAPCVSVLYPGQLHKARRTGEQTCRWVFITFRAETVFPRDFSLYDRLPWDNAAATRAVVDDAPLCRLMEELMREWEAREEGWEDCARGLLATLLVRHARLPRANADGGGERRDALRQLHPLLQYIDAHFAEPLSVTALAARAHMHPATLRTHFYAAVGVFPLQYIHRVRISAACALRRGTDRPVAVLAGEVGYLSHSAFNRHFLERCGVSPTRYREQRVL